MQGSYLVSIETAPHTYNSPLAFKRRPKVLLRVLFFLASYLSYLNPSQTLSNLKSNLVTLTHPPIIPFYYFLFPAVCPTLLLVYVV
jgi:hypothetical protein